MLGVHLHILDADTKQPTPVRLRITGPNGEHFMPFGHIAEFPHGRGEHVGGHVRFGTKRYCYIDGRCEVKLPPNVPITMEAWKGFEYKPLLETITLTAGQISVRLKIERAFDTKGLFSGDGRSHFLEPHAALLEAQAERLDVANLLALEHRSLGTDGNTYLSNSNLLAFSGQQAALTANRSDVYVNTLNRHPFLGSLALLHCHRPVFPLSFGEPDDWSLFDWIRQCHRKKGLVAWVDPFHGGEALLAALLGEIDALEITPETKAWLPLWYKLLNAGITIPLIGASGKDSNGTPLGAMRTYAYAAWSGEWLEAVRSGNSFITNGPLIEIFKARTILMAVRSIVPFQKLELIADGEVVDSVESYASGHEHAARMEKLIPKASWIAARVIGPPSELLPTMPAFAHTNAIRLSNERKAIDLRVFRDMIDATRDWAMNRAEFTDEKWRSQLLTRCDSALARLNV